jgi:drug/metabolite transporter (DMT)-like permease
MTIPRLAIISGILGATASCLAKFALAPESPVRLWGRELCNNHVGSLLVAGGLQACTVLEWVPRGIVLALMIVMNIVMVGAFLEGMDESGSVAGTGLASASNFAVSALYGIFLFNEEVDATWVAGFSLVIIGVTLLSTVQAQP